MAAVTIDPLTEERIAQRVFQMVRSLFVAGVDGQSNNDPEYWSTAQVERQFGIRRATVSKWVRTQVVDGKPGKPCLVKAKALRRFLLERSH